ncbi:hypothetical protein NMG60_11037376 [Bertholletia excelsa]
MEIPAKLLRFKFHILFAAAFSLLLLSLLYIAPSFLDVLAYFWPLLVSTALFLVAVTVFGQTSPPASGEKAGEGLLDFVAGQPEHVEIADESSKTSE